MPSIVFFLILTTVTFAGHVHSQRIYASINPAPVGSNLTIFSDTNITLGGWLLNNDILVFISPEVQIIEDAHKNRVIYDPATSSLTILSATQEYSGVYTLKQMNAFTAKLNISLQDPITAVVVKQTGGPAILHEPFSLTCNVTGPFDRIVWWKNDELIFADNTTIFDMTNETLTLSQAQLSDNGYYKCQAFNEVSNMTSSPYAVEINYGPGMPIIVAPNAVLAGNTANLSCWADSVPPSVFEWYFNGSLVSSMSEYVTPPLTIDSSGKYICMAFNNITGKNSTASIMLTVIDPIQTVQIEAQTNAAIEAGSYKLTCKIIGTVDQIYWMKNGEPLQEDNRTVFQMDNKTVMFNPVERSDTGNYQCMAINAFENITSPFYQFLVSYGPEMPTIEAPNAVMTGNTATLTCLADSVPQSTFNWYFNDSLVSNMSEYITPPLNKDMDWKFICMAFNPITSKNSTASIMLTVIDPIQNVQIEAQNNVSIEGGSYELICSLTGPVDFIYWIKNGEPLHADNRTIFSMDNKTMMLIQVENTDSGIYQCIAINAVENVTSAPYNLLVDHTYAIKSVMITNITMPINNENFTLTCNIIGRYDTISWKKDGMQLSMNASSTNSSKYHIKNNMLHFTPVAVENNGTYKCAAINKSAHHESPEYILRVNYGPMNIYISGPTSKTVGTSGSGNVSLTCSADSHPDCVFRWFMNTKSVPVGNGSVLTFSAVKKNEGNYICEATNPVTKLILTRNKTYAVAGHASATIFVSKGGLMFVGLCALSAHMLFL